MWLGILQFAQWYNSSHCVLNELFQISFNIGFFPKMESYDECILSTWQLEPCSSLRLQLQCSSFCAAASMRDMKCRDQACGDCYVRRETKKNRPIQTVAPRHMNRSLVSGLETSSASLASSHSLLMTGWLLFIVIHRRGQVIKLGATGLFGSQDKITDSSWKRTASN